MTLMTSTILSGPAPRKLRAPETLVTFTSSLKFRSPSRIESIVVNLGLTGDALTGDIDGRGAEEGEEELLLPCEVLGESGRLPGMR